MRFAPATDRVCAVPRLSHLRTTPFARYAPAGSASCAWGAGLDQKKAFKDAGKWNVDVFFKLKSLRLNTLSEVALMGFPFGDSDDPVLLLLLSLLLAGAPPRCLTVGSKVAHVLVASSTGSGTASLVDPSAALISRAFSERKYQHDEQKNDPLSTVAQCDTWAGMQVVSVLHWLVQIYAADLLLSAKDPLGNLARELRLDLSPTQSPLALAGPNAALSPVRTQVEALPCSTAGAGKRQAAASGR